MITVKTVLALFVMLYLSPIGISAVLYRLGVSGAGWRTADWSSIGLLPPASRNPEAMVRVFATHSRIVLKPAGADEYPRYDDAACGGPIRLNGVGPDGPGTREQPMEAAG